MRYNRLYKETNNIPPTDYTGELARYLINLKYEDLPEAVVARAKNILLQTAAIVLEAKEMDLAQKADRLAVEGNNGLGGTTTRWLWGGQLSPANAALLAGTLADAVEWEKEIKSGHPFASIIATAVIAAEEKGKSGKDLITAVVGAYEIYQRIVNAAKPKETSRVGITSWQIFGTTAAAAKLYDFTPEQADRAFGVAAELSTIPVGYRKEGLSDFYHFEHGYRARDGILIAKEVQLGIHNARGTLDDTRPSGYLASVTASPRPEWLTKELGSRYLILEIAEEPHRAAWAEKDVERLLHIEKYDSSDVVSFLVP